MAKARWRDWIVVGLGVALAARTGGNVWRLYKAGERVKEAQAELAQATEENQQLRVRLEEVRSQEFLESQARERLGYGREGEVILVAPEPSEGNKKNGGGEGGGKPNWKRWWEVYIGV